MPASESSSERINAALLELQGGDPFSAVFDACEPHREAHTAALNAADKPDCGVYPAAPQKMHALATIVKAIGARRGLEIGGGIGYSALWLAEAMGLAGLLETIDRDAEHVALIDQYAREYDLAGRLLAIEGEAIDVLKRLPGPYDFIHDDGWFAEEPAYYERMIELLRPGGLLILANCFLVEDAISGEPRMDWSVFAGPDWAKNVLAYTKKLSSDERLHVSYLMRPSWVGLAYKRPDA